MIAGNKTTYYCTFIYSYGLKVVYEYDDSAILSYKSLYKNQYNDDMELHAQIDYVYSAEVTTGPDYKVNVTAAELATYLTNMGVSATDAAKFSVAEDGKTISYTYDSTKAAVTAVVGQ